MPTEKEINEFRKATIFDIYLLIDGKEKKDYTKEEILELLKDIAKAKEE